MAKTATHITVDGERYDLQDAELAQDVSDLKSALTFDENSLSDVTGEVLNRIFERRLRYINNGSETFANQNNRISVKQGQYLNFKANDKIILLGNVNYKYLGGYSTDGGTTWTGISNTVNETVIPSDSIGFVCITKNSGQFNDNDDYTSIAKQLMKIVRLTATNYSSYLRDETWDAFSKAMMTEFKTAHIINEIYVNTTAGQKLWATSRVNEFPARKDDILQIKASLNITTPGNFSSYGIRIVEANDSNVKQAYTDKSDLSAVIEYTVSNDNTTKVYINPYVITESGAISKPYNETFELNTCIAKGTVQDVYTESGDNWEV